MEEWSLESYPKLQQLFGLLLIIAIFVYAAFSVEKDKEDDNDVRAQ